MLFKIEEKIKESEVLFMRKYFMLFLFVIGTLLLLAGCNKDDKDAKEWNDILGKSQLIKVLSPGESDITTIKDNKQIEDFIDKLKIDKWKLEDIPADAKKERKYVMYQKDTIQLGETGKNNTELNEAGHIVKYKDTPYIDLKIKNINISFKVPDDVANYLSDISS